MRILLPALLILLILPFSFAALLEPATLRMALGFIVLIVVAMLALTYMMGKSLNSPQLEAWSKTELRELIIAAILFIIVNGIIIGADNGIKLLTGKNSYITVAHNFLSDTMGDLEAAYKDGMRLSHYLTMRSGFSTFSDISEFWFFSTTFSGAPFAGASVFFGPLQMATQGLANAWFEYAGIRLLLDYAITASEVLLPIAFIFRFIPFSRQLGSTLIALAIGGAVIFPFSIVIVSELHDLLGNSLPNPNVDEDSFNALGDFGWIIKSVEKICSVKAVRVLLSLNETFFSYIVCLPVIWIPGAYPACTQLVQLVVYPAIQLLFRGVYSLLFASQGLLGIFGGEPTGWLTGEELTNIIYPFLEQVNNFVLLAYVDALIIAIITYIGIKSVSSILGGEYMMPAINRLVR